MGEQQERIMTSDEKLKAAINLRAYLDSEVPKKYQIEVIAIAIKSERGGWVIRYDGGIV